MGKTRNGLCGLALSVAVCLGGGVQEEAGMEPFIPPL